MGYQPTSKPEVSAATHLLLVQAFENGLQISPNRLNLRLGFQVDLVIVLGSLVRFLRL